MIDACPAACQSGASCTVEALEWSLKKNEQSWNVLIMWDSIREVVSVHVIYLVFVDVQFCHSCQVILEFRNIDRLVCAWNRSKKSAQQANRHVDNKIAMYVETRRPLTMVQIQGVKVCQLLGKL